MADKIKRYIQDVLSRDGAMMFSLIDPLDYKDIDHAVETAKNAREADVDLILIGGSIGVQGPFLDEVTKRIKEETSLPVVLFPGNIATITPYADGMYFMSLMNSRNPYWITRAQMLAAPLIKKMGIEALPLAYIVVEPGGTVGWVGDVDLIPRNKEKIAAAFATAAELMGFHYVLTDTGSNPKEHIPLEMISAVRKATSLPYIVGGGIKTAEQAGNVIKAGADIIQVGTAFESENAVEHIRGFVKAVKENGKGKV